MTGFTDFHPRRRLYVIVFEQDPPNTKSWMFLIDGGLKQQNYQVARGFAEPSRNLYGKNLKRAPIVPARILERARAKIEEGDVFWIVGDEWHSTYLLDAALKAQIAAEARRRLKPEARKAK